MSSQQQSGSLRRRTLSRFAALGGSALIVSTILMTVAVATASAATVAKTGTAIGAVWTNPGNVNASDDVYSTATPLNGSSLSQAYNSFAFGIVGGSIITDIAVSVEAKSSDTSGCTLDVQISGNTGATLLAATSTINLTGSDAAYTRSGTWGQVWDPTQLSPTTFRVVLKANNDQANACADGSTTSVDSMSVTVTYETIKNGTANADISTSVCDKADFNFIVDMSGSIGAQGNAQSNLPDLQKGINDFVTTFQASGDGRYSGTKFNGDIGTANMTAGYQSAATFQAAVTALSGPGGLTPTSAGIAAGVTNNANDRAGVQNIMFVVTDGSPNQPPGSPLTSPATWLTAANAAITAANTARSTFVVKAVYLSTAGDPGDTTLPFSNPDGDASWASSVMKEIGGGSFLPGDFKSFATDLLKAIHCTPDIKVVKTADNSPIAAGATAAFTITVSNIGKGAAMNATLDDPLPAGVAWVLTSPVTGCAITSNTLHCNFGTLTDGETRTIKINGVTDAADCGTLENTATVAATNEPSDVKGNNSSTDTITVQCGSIKIIKDAVPNDGQDFAFTTTGTGLPGFSLDDDSDGQLPNNRTFSVAPGAYSVKETAVGGWKLTDLTCNDTNGTVDKTTGLATLNVSAGENVVCTYTNTKLGSITVKKLTSPSGAPGSFAFSGDLAGSIADKGTITLGNLLPGVYHTTEADPAPPFDLGSITCDDNNSSGVIGTGVATYNLEAGENITCTFTNVKRGSINIIKDAQPNDPQDFGFTTTGTGLSSFDLDDDPASQLSDTKAFTNIKPGTYSVTEGATDGWDLTGLDCQSPDTSTGVKNGSTANITLAPGGSVTCTYTNTKAGQVIVKKVMVGGTDTFTYTGTPAGSIDANNGTISANVKPGTYVATEAAKAGWDLTNVTCSDTDSTGSVGNANATFHVAAGEIVTCTFTNTKRGKIVVDKVTNPAADPQEFTFSTNYSADFKLTDAAAPNNSAALIPGTYNVSEASVAGWSLTSAICSDGSPIGAISVAAGETVTCTFTNTKAGHILVDKITDPAKDGQPFEFYASWSQTTFFLTDEAAPHDSGLLAPGTYSVIELFEPGWDLTSYTCSGQNDPDEIHLQAGQTVTCTFTNTKRGHILVDKVTDPAGDPQSFEFKTNYSNNFFLTDASSPNDSGALKPGSYAIGELAAAGWDLTKSSCSDQSPVNEISLQPGETVTCTFTNTKRGSITVEKQTSPNGASGSFVFSGDVAGSLSDGGSKTTANLKPGTYTSTEAAQAGWDLGAIVCDDANSKTPSSGNTGTGTATFKLDPGENITCVFTNVQRGTITIIKDAQPDSSQNFSFTTSGTGLSSFGLVDNGDAGAATKVFQNLVAGSYSVTEGSVDGWDLKSLSCNPLGGSKAEIDGATANLTLAEGGSITCTYTNSKPSIDVVKTAGNAADGDEFVTGPGPVTYTYVVKNTGTVALENIVVTDDNGTPGTGDDFTATCPKTTLAAGESMTCSKTVTVTSDRTNNANASGFTVKGTPVKDSDWAVVRIPGIGIDKSADDNKVEPNQIVTYTIDVSVSSGPVSNAVVTDHLPAGQTYQAGSSSPSEPVITDGGKTLTWTFASLDNGDPTETITYKVKIDGDATTETQVNTVTVCVSELKDCKTDEEHVTPEKPGVSIVKTAGDAEDGDVYKTEPGNVTYTYVVKNTGPLPLEKVTVTDDNGTPGDDEDDFDVDCPKATLAPGESMTCTATVAVIEDTVNTAVVHGSTAEGNPVEADDDAEVVILVHGLIIDKSNDAPIDATLHIPEAPVGSTVNYTLKYTFSGDPVTNGVIHDVLPAGIKYVASPGATSSDEFLFIGYDEGTRTLTWKAATVTKSGQLQYQATVLEEAEGFGPLTNTATISSDQTKVDDAKSDIFVPTIPEAETSEPTPPQTDVFDGSGGTAGPGISLLLMFGILGVLIVGLAFITPVPEVVRRRNRR